MSETNDKNKISKIIELKNISKVYYMGEVQVEALKKINLKVDRGEFLSIMGPSGSGKSTMLHILGGLDTPTEGEYLLEDTDISLLSDKELARIRNQHFGFVFQTFNLLNDFTALENVTIPMIFARLSKKERVERAIKLLESVGLVHRLSHYPTQLSGGERQRVAIARALANDPTLILADEPTGNLNTKQGKEIMKILSDLNEQGVTIIMVTHSVEISIYAKRVLELADGKINSDKLGAQDNNINTC
ncbi:ABC transporter ATP-binding protein [Natronospora cellulosivora (SeqCode)]